ncbi:MAG TPA: AraC family transcriptional regulator [Chitinophaga sp.]|uniref:helix-turn-helix domain-containing protein n=1 Tax=Chitinophaga sp. TaxID=1869181 RepID=UPI002CC53E55|nr:AraC family transcriptional regulator [Chitinophaga sp.]HVI46429.1 AraC family transcriptional regulator [Chitinophaga sp.]
MAIPQKYLSRQAELTEIFIHEVDKHIDDIVAGRTDVMYHIKDIARIMFVHPVHLSNTIKLYSGHAPCYFFENRLMDEAKRMLRDTDLSITDIATRLTFDNSNFTKFFKRFAGVTPGAWRKEQPLAVSY